MIYFIQAVDGGPVKIGFAVEPKRRIAEIQRMSPSLLRVLALIDGDRKYEGELHRYFAKLRQYGEWFKAEQELLDFIANPLPVIPVRPIAPKRVKKPKREMTLNQAKRQGVGSVFVAGNDPRLTKVIETIEDRRGDEPLQMYAKRIGLSRAALSRYYNAKRGINLPTIRKLAEFYNKIGDNEMLSTLLSYTLGIDTLFKT